MPSIRWLDDYEDGKSVLWQCLGYVVLPIVFAVIVFGPGLSGAAGLVYRVPLGFLWYLGGLILLIGLIISLFTTSRSSKKTKRLYLMLLVGYTLATTLVYLSLPTVNGVESMFVQNVPIGSSRAQVVSFLKARNIHYNPNDEMVIAAIPDYILSLGFVQTTFEFDKNSKLTRMTSLHNDISD